MTTGRINQVTTLRELGALSRAAIPTRGRRHRDTQLARTLQNDLACFDTRNLTAPHTHQPFATSRITMHRGLLSFSLSCRALYSQLRPSASLCTKPYKPYMRESRFSGCGILRHAPSTPAPCFTTAHAKETRHSGSVVLPSQ